MYNKKYELLKYCLIVLVLSMLFVRCDEALDKVRDLSNYPAEGTFDDIQAVNAYLASLYQSAFSGWPVNEGNFSDESGSIIGSEWITINNGTMKFWPYDIIRRVNIMLSEISVGEIPLEDQTELVAQAKFIRAYLYFKMVKYHGGVPIIDEVQNIDDDLFVERNSTEECFEFIINDLNEAISELPVRYRGDDYGRIDQATAKSFLGIVLLYKASPQFNPSNPYNNEFWQLAYDVNKEAKDYLDANGYGLLDNYDDVFMTSEHKENIFSVVYQDPIKTNGRGEDAVRPLSESKNATGGDQPIWALVEAYPMKDGFKIDDPKSQYTYDVQEFWKNRDPRMTQTIVWNGKSYPLSGKTERRQYTMANIAHSVDAFGYVVQGESHYRTGFFCRKGIQEELSSELVTSNDVDWPEIRYVEVLFNFAEAANEVGNSREAIDALISVRSRAGIEPGDNGMYGLKENMTREEIREAILAEKYIEMAFEGKRFWDLRRHRMLDRLDGMRKFGLMAVEVNGRKIDEVTAEDIRKARDYELLPEDFRYEVVELITSGPKEMVMPEKYYFFPIQLTHIDKNPKLEQNIAWGGSFNPVLQ